jgi:hypothetical protein
MERRATVPGSALEAEIGHLAESVRDEAAWAARGAALRTEYLAGRPWPHVVVEDLFPRALVEAAEEQELPATASLVPHRSHLRLTRLQESFSHEHALQCGYCTPGMLIAATALLQENPSPTADEVKHAMAGQLCRCTGYEQIVRAVVAAANSDGKGDGLAERT